MRCAASSTGVSAARPSTGVGLAMRGAYTRRLMRRPIPEDGEIAAVIAEEEAILARVERLIASRSGADGEGGGSPADYDADLIALRDQIADEKPEDVASLVEQMTRL